MSGDDYEMISKVAMGVNRPGEGCTGCVGVNIAREPRWFRERAGLWSYALPPPIPHPPALQGAKMFKGCWGQGLHLGIPHDSTLLQSPPGPWRGRRHIWLPFVNVLRLVICIYDTPF